MFEDTATLQDVNELDEDQPIPESEREEDLPPPITAMPRGEVPLGSVPEEMTPPPVAGSLPATQMPGTPPPRAINPDLAPPAPAGYNPNQASAENPFHALLTREQNIHNPVARVAAKVGTHLLGGLAALSPEVRREEAEAEERPAKMALEQAQTRDIGSQAAQREAQTARMASGQPPIKNPVPLYSGNEQVGEEGYDEYGQFHRNMFPSDQVPAGPGNQQPPPIAGGPASQGVAGAPAGGQAPPPRPMTTLKPQEPQRAPLPTAEETAKLKPVGTNADTFNREIADIPGIKAKDFPVTPETTQEDADKILAAAHKQGEAARGKVAEDRGAASETRANQTEDLKPVQATDKDGRTIITNFGDARKAGMTDVLPVGATEIQTARSTLTNVNLMEQALKSMKENLSDFDALSAADKRDLNQILNSPAVTQPGGALHYISGSIGGAVESMLQSAEYQEMSEPAKNILRNIVNLRESSLGLGKLETGGSKAMQAGIDAINATIPGRNITNAKDAETQLRMFADRLDEIKAEAPVIKGHAFRENPFTQGGGKQGDTRTYQGYTYTKGNDGQWHRGNKAQ